MNNNIIQFRDSGLKKALAEKGRVSAIARRDLVRYQNLLKWSLKSLNFERNEIMLLIDTMNGSMGGDFDIDPATLLLVSVADSCDFGMDKKWEVDKSALIKKLQRLSRVEAAALLDAIERFWYEPDSYQIDTEEKLKAIGFVFEEEGDA